MARRYDASCTTNRAETGPRTTGTTDEHTAAAPLVFHAPGDGPRALTTPAGTGDSRGGGRE